MTKLWGNAAKRYDDDIFPLQIDSWDKGGACVATFSFLFLFLVITIFHSIRARPDRCVHTLAHLLLSYVSFSFLFFSLFLLNKIHLIPLCSRFAFFNMNRGVYNLDR